MNFSARYLTDPKFKALLAVARLDKPVGTLLLLWPTLAALWIAAEGWPGWHLLLVFVLGTFLTRSAGCVVNDIADRKFDPFVERTQDRPLAQGVITVRAALLWMGVLLGLAAILVLTTNVLTIVLAAVGACFAGLYPFMKRITHLPQLVLGLAFSMGIPMAFTAVTGALSEAAGLLFLANLVWVVAYDTEYAMVDRAEDLLIGVKSTAILFGDLDRFIIGVLQALFVLLLWQVGGHLDFSAVYQGLLAVIAGLLCYQQFLIRDQSREGSFAAFKNNQWVGGTFFLAVLIECEAML
ncbi:4-hydroxybenzoate octaprenyltransferase [Pseudomonadales bacterium]|jgi:4-hydroxybenzoate polyprenyltransferase|nr:4-hydroxybenzoate octaprenyltransferase [Gammaproteobacteria bacterium]MDA0825432.1 4-hydroxybenzoate octaprenyltransferase [Pseudomonadota bacterium]MDA8863873.1 4-hydroxybenzoate octaprenyltransferase [Pseudomonadales bacterium]MBT5463455.1 4-hydroxybenzoate octaprenyltransferase [Gammaproteobacteria bacterium]MBT7388342.1 4-hydroxybenzoate octaprenyltransferase [Gammaproteobacteria bacterium]|tara:strand:+ start:175 stop:1059 length:885 start_codon:yes stop_codon:yes gene_type:complete